MRRLAVAVAALVIIVVAALLVFGGDDPELSPQDQSTPTAIATATPTATATATAATISVRIGEDGLEVDPLTVTRDGRTVFLAYENTTGDAVEVVFTSGNPRSQAAIQKALVTGAVIEAGQKRRDGVQIDPGRYTVLVRAPSEDTDPTDTVSLEVR